MATYPPHTTPYPPQQNVGGYPPPAAANSCVSKIELHISCKGLPRMDITSSSDPMAVLLMQDKSSKQWIEIARTERVKNTENPSFATPILVDYRFEEVQKMKISMYDIDCPSESLEDDDFLGSIEASLGQIVSSGTYTKSLDNKYLNDAGTISVRCEEVSSNSDKISLTFKAQNLDKKDFLGKSDPFLEFSRVNEDGSFMLVHRNEVIKNTLNPIWQPFTIPVQQLCNGDLQRTIQVSCYDYDDDGGHDLIGTFTTDVNEMMKATQQEVSWSCINPKKQKKKKNYVNSGIVTLSYCRYQHGYSFVDFISHGCQINFTVAVDFTMSNGDPSRSDSLHYINPYQPNDYTAALLSVGEVCQDYDTDKMFPSLGFGAQIPPDFKVHHDFPLNFNFQNPYCAGLNGILEAYQGALRQVRFLGPTLFSPVINHVARFAAEESQSGVANAYFILLILTDGEITDMNNTVKSIIDASYLPMSIIIVGVGPAEFDNMEELDADKKKLSHHGKSAARDIVQFVPFRNLRGAPSFRLAQEVLAEIPGQVTEYFQMKGIAPKFA